MSEVWSSSTNTIEENQLKFSNNFLGTRHMIRWYKNKIRELEGPKLRETMKRITLSEIRSSSTNTIEDDQWKHSNGSSGPHQQIPLKTINGNIQTALPVLIT